MTRPLLAAAAAWALAACDADRRCLSDAQCRAPEEACRLTVDRCPGYDTVAILSEGHCRDVGASCSSDLDCVPAETCQQGTCKPDPSLCSGTPPACPARCTWTAPFPCACVCQACPP